MENYFEKQERVTGPSYPKYFLQYNPFHVSEALKEKEDAGDTRALFLRHVYQKEINKVMACVRDLADQPEMPRLWILKDNSAAAEHNISVIGGAFRSILRSELPRLFPTYAPLPMLVSNTLREVVHLLIDRFRQPIFQRCIYTFIYRELQELLKSNRASEVLPEIDISNLLKRMNESEGEAILEVLFPKKEEEEPEVESQKSEEGEQSEVESQESEDEEQSEVESHFESTQSRQESEEEEKSGVRSQESEEEEKSGVRSQESEEEEELEEEETEEEKKQRELAERLADFIAEAAEQKQFGDQVQSAIEASVRHGFDKGLLNLSQYLEYQELIPGLMRLLLYSFEKIVVLIDQLDLWSMFEDIQKGRFMGALSEFEWLAKDKAILIFASYPEVTEDMGEAHTAGFKKQTLDLKLSNIDATTSINHEQAVSIVTEFLKSDSYRNQKLDHLKKKKLNDLYPFTEGSVKAMVEHEDGNIASVLDLSRKLLDEGKRAGYPAIDQKFVKKILK